MYNTGMTQSVSELIELWPEPRTTNFGKDIGVTVEHAATIKRRNSIPVRFWPKVLEGARERDIQGVSYEVLVSIHQDAESAA